MGIGRRSAWRVRVLAALGGEASRVVLGPSVSMPVLRRPIIGWLGRGGLCRGARLVRRPRVVVQVRALLSPVALLVL